MEKEPARQPVPLSSQPTMGSEPTGASSPSAISSDRLETIIAGRYVVKGELGRGGYGIVYKVWDTQQKSLLALKKISDSLDPERMEQVKKRFVREIRSMEECTHDHIVRMYDYDLDAGYFTMDLIEGTSLEKYLREKKKMGMKEAATLMKTIAMALDYAHQKGIVHRDIKAQNVLIGKKVKNEGGGGGVPESVYLSDFGIALVKEDEVSRMTRTGELIGTPQYMSPEQIRGKRREITKSSDIWSSGVLLYHLLTGEFPFPGKTLSEITRQIERDKPRLFQGGKLHPKLQGICLKALQKEPKKRYRTAGEMAEDLARFLDKKSLLHSASNTPKYLAIGVLSILLVFGALFFVARISRQKREETLLEANNLFLKASETKFSSSMPLALLHEKEKLLAGALSRIDSLGDIGQEREKRNEIESRWRLALAMMGVKGISSDFHPAQKELEGIEKNLEIARALSLKEDAFRMDIVRYGWMEIEERIEAIMNGMAQRMKDSVLQREIADQKAHWELWGNARQRHLEKACHVLRQGPFRESGLEVDRLYTLGNLYLRQGMLLRVLSSGQEWEHLNQTFNNAISFYSQAIRMSRQEGKAPSRDIFFNKSYALAYKATLLKQSKAPSEDIQNFYKAAQEEQEECLLECAKLGEATHRDYWHNLESFQTRPEKIQEIAREVLRFNPKDQEAGKIYSLGQWEPGQATLSVPFVRNYTKTAVIWNAGGEPTFITAERDTLFAFSLRGELLWKRALGSEINDVRSHRWEEKRVFEVQVKGNLQIMNEGGEVLIDLDLQKEVAHEGALFGRGIVREFQDIDGDGRQEMIVTTISQPIKIGATPLYPPRRLLVYRVDPHSPNRIGPQESKNGSPGLHARFLGAPALNNVQFIKQPDGTSDLILGSYAISNGIQTFDTEDSSCYVFRISPRGQKRWATRIGGQFMGSDVIVQDIDRDGRDEIYALVNRTWKADEGALYQLDLQGKVMKNATLPHAPRSYRMLDDQPGFLYLTDNAGDVYKLDSSFRVVKKASFGGAVRFSGTGDYTGKGKQEFLAISYRYRQNDTAAYDLSCLVLSSELEVLKKITVAERLEAPPSDSFRLYNLIDIPSPDKGRHGFAALLDKIVVYKNGS